MTQMQYSVHREEIRSTTSSVLNKVIINEEPVTEYNTQTQRSALPCIRVIKLLFP